LTDTASQELETQAKLEASVPFPLSDQFEERGLLGAGGVGVVYKTLDRQRGAEVALKVLKRPPFGTAILKFKAEFRRIQGIDHPNLVKLYELFEHDGQWFYTMELVDGKSFLEYVRPPASADGAAAPANSMPPDPDTWSPRHDENGEILPTTPPSSERLRPQYGPLDLERLRSSLVQLAGVLISLHRQDLIHRDVKPSNILVTPEGRVVLLDFGLVAAPGIIHDGGCTIAYRSPEQEGQGIVDTASDWYSVGVVLFEALTGRLPGQRGPSNDARDTTRLELLSLSDDVRDLGDLCATLLHLEPRQRPTGEEVLCRLGSRTHAVSSQWERLPFVGRQQETAALLRAYEETRHSRAITVLVGAESGVGKTQLISEFGKTIGKRALVFSGRCYERESVPYKAFDEIIDSLSEHLLTLSREDAGSILPSSLALLKSAFPVLARVPTIAEVRSTDSVLEPHALRARVFAALRELFARLAEHSPVVLLIDDLQWADPDSLALMKNIVLGADAPALLIVATGRMPFTSIMDDLRRRLSVDEGLREIRLQPFSRQETLEMVNHLTGAGERLGNAQTLLIAEEARGHPLFIQELVRQALPGHKKEDAPQVTLDQALRRRIERQGLKAKRLIEILSVAGRPLNIQVAAACAEVNVDRLFSEANALRAQNLIRAGGTHSFEMIEPYHDRIREAVLATLDESWRSECHRRLANELGREAETDPETLAIHWKGAGEYGQAARFSTLAAEQAVAVLAFDRAARLYRDALDLGLQNAQAHRVKIGLAEALANSGRGEEAARAYLDAANEIEDPQLRFKFQRSAADQLVRSGRIDNGLEVFADVLLRLGLRLPRSSFQAFVRLMWVRLRLRIRGTAYRERNDASADELARIDVCYALGTGLATFEHLNGPLFFNQGILLALNAGEPTRVVRALALEAVQRTVTNLHPAAYDILKRSDELARRVDDPASMGLASLCYGIVDQAYGKWNAAYGHYSRASQILRARCLGHFWDRAFSELGQSYCLFYLGQLSQASDRILDMIREADQRNDLFLAMNARIHYHNLAWLREGRVAEARAAIETAQAARGTDRQFTSFDLWTLLALVNTDLFAGEQQRAWHRVEPIWPKARRSLTFRVLTIMAEGEFLYGRAALAARRLPESERTRVVHQTAKRLGRLNAPWTHVLAGLLRACAAKAVGNLENAEAELSRIVPLAEAAGMRLHAAVARWCWGNLLAGDQGSSLRLTGEAVLGEQRFRDPKRLVAILAPTFAT
jgi:serine/threonine protein kinase